MRFVIAWKIGLLVTVPVAAVAYMVGSSVYNTSIDLLVDHEKTDLRDESKVLTEKIRLAFALLREDVVKLASTAPVQGLMRAKQANPNSDNPTDPVSGRSQEQLRADVATIFEQIVTDELNNPKPYLQVRLIEKIYPGNEVPPDPDERHARELVRVERQSGSDHFKTIAIPHQSADVSDADADGYWKGDRAYFRKTWQLANENKNYSTKQIYLSEVELNVEDGKKQIDSPVLRAAVPVYNSKNELFAIVVINLQLRWLAKEIVSSPRHLTYLTNDRGDFLIHPDKDKEFIFDLDEEGLKKVNFADTAGKQHYRIQDLPAFAEIAHLYSNEYVDPTILDSMSGRIGRELESQGLQFREKLYPDDDVFSLARITCADETTWKEIHGNLTDELKALQDEKSTNGEPKYPWLRCPRELSATAMSFQIRARTIEQSREIADTLLAKFPGQLAVEYVISCESFAAHYHRIYFDPRRPKRHLALVMAFSYEELIADLAPTKRSMIIRTIFVTLLVGCVSFLLTQPFVRRLKQVTRASESIAKGNLQVSLPLDRQDELGDLARGFQHMIQEVVARGAEVRDREARLNMIFDSAAEGILTLDRHGTIQTSNGAAQRMFGYEHGELDGKPIDEFVASDDQHLLRNCFEGVDEEDSSARLVSLEVTGRRRDDSQFPLDLSISTASLEDQLVVTLIMRDITERRRHEERLNAWNEQLAEAVTQRTDELQQANSALQAAHKKAQELSLAKDSFLASVSHELRNPLNQVSGFCQLLELGNLDEEQLADVAKIRMANDQLLALINDILDYQKIIMGGIALEPEPFDVAMLLEEIRDATSVQANDNNNEIHFESSDDVGQLVADKQRVRQVLLNLVSNACKFTVGGRVAVSAKRATENGHQWIEFSVTDTGRGMTPEEQAKLFTPFTKLSRKKGNRSGTGLGLVISKGFCELMRGDVGLRSEFGKGTTFTVRLPADKDDHLPQVESQAAAVVGANDLAGVLQGVDAVTETASVDTASEAGQEAVLPEKIDRQRLVLVIDDEASVREIMQRYLSGKGFQVVTASSGLEGLRLAKTLKPSVITLDAVMPGLDGWAVLGALKASEETKSIPVVMVTFLDEEEKGVSHGATDFILKPIDWDRLSGSLARFTGEKRDRSILVVDDDSSTREILRRNLQQDGWKVLEAENGAVALEIMVEERPAAIVLDLVMPVMDGFEFLVQFSQLGEWLAVPIIVLTAKDPTPEERQRLEGRVVRVLRKGKDTSRELLAEIHHRVDNHLQDQHINTEGS